MIRLVLAVTTLVLGACAAVGRQGDLSSQSSAERMVVANVLPFDIAACGARAVPLGAPSDELVMGALLSIGPATQECFTDGASLDGATLDAKLKVTVGAEVSFEVLGTGVSASGKECLLAAAKKLPFKPLEAGAKPAKPLEAGAKPVSGEVPVQPGGKAVVFGINPASDAAGTIRLAQPSFCSCYAELGTKPAPVLVANLKLFKEKPVEVELEPNQVPTVAACVSEKLKALKLPSADVQLPYQFLLKNAYADAATPEAQPALQFQQLDGVRAQKTADVLLAVGQRVPVARAYDALVAKYKATRPEKAWPLIGELKTKCAALLAADDVWVASLKTLVGVYQSSLDMAKTEKAKDPAWAPVEDALTRQMGDTSQELARVEGQRKNDEGACPKSK